MNPILGLSLTILRAMDTDRRTDMGRLPDITNAALFKGGIQRTGNGHVIAALDGEILGTFDTWEEAESVYHAARYPAAGVPSQG